jgi:insertion element IS1 protein InsB
MWSYVGSKRHPRWLWWVQEAATGQVVAFVFGRRSHATFERLRQVLAQAGVEVEHWITDAWWAYGDRLPAQQREEDKAQLQGLERKHLTLRTRLKRLTRKTICFSKKTFFHDGLVALFIHHFFFQTPNST